MRRAMIALGLVAAMGLSACSAPRVSAYVDLSEQTVTPRAAFRLGTLGVSLRP